MTDQIRLLVDGRPAWELAETQRNDLGAMLRCCGVVEATYWAAPYGSRLAPAPYYFERVAVLSSKMKDFQAAADACKRYLAMAEDYASQPSYLTGRMALVDLSPNGRIPLRLEKAMRRLALSRSRK